MFLLNFYYLIERVKLLYLIINKKILSLILFISVRVGLAVLLVVVIRVLSKKIRFDREGRSPFECGFSTKEERRFPFSLRFFLVAIIFLIFDIEVLLLFPFVGGVLIRNSVVLIFIYFNFIFILSAGLYYE